MVAILNFARDFLWTGGSEVKKMQAFGQISIMSKFQQNEHVTAICLWLFVIF